MLFRSIPTFLPYDRIFPLNSNPTYLLSHFTYPPSRFIHHRSLAFSHSISLLETNWSHLHYPSLHNDTLGERTCFEVLQPLHNVSTAAYADMKQVLEFIYRTYLGI